MLNINAHKAGVALLNTILETRDLSTEVMDDLYNALMLLDPQPEEQGDPFYHALAYAYERNAISAETLQALLEDYE